MPDKYTSIVRKIAEEHGNPIKTAETAEQADSSSKFKEKPLSPLTSADLKEIRKRAGMSQPEMVAKIGVSVSIYQMWEQGTRRMPDEYTERVQKIAQEYSTRKSENEIRSPFAKKPISPITAADLKDIRHKLGITQKAMIAKIGVSLSIYQDWESGRRCMPDEYTKRIQDVAGIKPSAEQVKKPNTGSIPEQSKPEVQTQEQNIKTVTGNKYSKKNPSSITVDELKSIRAFQKFTQPEFAEIIGVSASLYQKWEQEKRFISDEFTEKIRSFAPIAGNPKPEKKKRVVPSTSSARIIQRLSPHQSAITGEDLKAIREKAKLTQLQMGDIIGVKRKTYQAWELGRSNMPDRYTEAVRELAEEKSPEKLAALKAEFKKCRQEFGADFLTMARVFEVHHNTYVAWEDDPAQNIPRKYVERLRHLTKLSKEARDKFFERQGNRYKR